MACFYFDARSERPRTVPLTRARGSCKHPVSIRWKQCCQTRVAYRVSAARKFRIWGCGGAAWRPRMEGNGRLVSCRQDISAIVNEQTAGAKHKVGSYGGVVLALVHGDLWLTLLFNCVPARISAGTSPRWDSCAATATVSTGRCASPTSSPCTAMPGRCRGHWSVSTLNPADTLPDDYSYWRWTLTASPFHVSVDFQVQGSNYPILQWVFLGRIWRDLFQMSPQHG